MLDLQQRFEAKIIPEPNSGCWLWTAGYFKDSGYGSFRVSTDPRKSNEGAHRVSWKLYRGSIPEGYCILHRCDVRECVNPDHLFIGTKGDNNRDTSQKGRHYTGTRYAAPGELHPMVKLTNENVAHIRASDETGAALARKFNVSQTQILRIRQRKSWRHT